MFAPVKAGTLADIVFMLCIHILAVSMCDGSQCAMLHEHILGHAQGHRQSMHQWPSSYCATGIDMDMRSLPVAQMRKDYHGCIDALECNPGKQRCLLLTRNKLSLSINNGIDSR